MDKSKLFKLRLGEEDVEVPNVGTVRVRSLSRAECLEFQGKETQVAELERKMLALAMVDPVLTEDEVGEWQKASSAGELTKVLMVVVRISGMDDSALKEAMQTFRE